jgi:TRAP-type mannitol/chloroaromatic compound transport system permease large subunit
VLALLVLQMGFLLPPLGYAVLMVGSLLPERLSTRRLARALVPYLLVQAVVIAGVWCWPGVVWHSRAGNAEVAPVSDEELQKLFDQQRLDSEAPAPDAAP